MSLFQLICGGQGVYLLGDTVLKLDDNRDASIWMKLSLLSRNLFNASFLLTENPLVIKLREGFDITYLGSYLLTSRAENPDSTMVVRCSNGLKLALKVERYSIGRFAYTTSIEFLNNSCHWVCEFFNKRFPLMGSSELPNANNPPKKLTKKQMDELSKRMPWDQLLYENEIPSELHGDEILKQYPCCLSNKPARIPFIIEKPGKQALFCDLNVLKSWPGEVPTLDCDAAIAEIFGYIDTGSLKVIDDRLQIISEKLAVRQSVNITPPSAFSWLTSKCLELGFRGLSCLTNIFDHQQKRLSNIINASDHVPRSRKIVLAATVGMGLTCLVSTIGKTSLQICASTYRSVNNYMKWPQDPLNNLYRIGVFGYKGIKFNKNN